MFCVSVFVVMVIASMATGSFRYDRALLHGVLNDRVYTANLSFDTPARSNIECNKMCTMHPDCVAFTFVRSTLTCRGHWSLRMAAGESTESAGAQTWIYVSSMDAREWTVLQRRQDGSVDFYRSWTEYANGFGNYPNGELWIGLETMHVLTSEGTWQVRFDMGDWRGNTAYAMYTGFCVKDSADKYRLMFDSGSYTGTAGDSLATVNGKMFTTKDSDNDEKLLGNCANVGRGGWWARNCFEAHPNAEYSTREFSLLDRDGIFWKEWKGLLYQLKSMQIKMRRLY